MSDFIHKNNDFLYDTQRCSDNMISFGCGTLVELLIDPIFVPGAASNSAILKQTCYTPKRYEPSTISFPAVSRVYLRSIHIPFCGCTAFLKKDIRLL